MRDMGRNTARTGRWPIRFTKACFKLAQMKLAEAREKRSVAGVAAARQAELDAEKERQREQRRRERETTKAAAVPATRLRWLEQPTLLPALVFGALTVVAPWFVMQPAMGAGVLALKTPTPLKNGLRNLANHTVFGVGLYVAAATLAPVAA